MRAQGGARSTAPATGSAEHAQPTLDAWRQLGEGLANMVAICTARRDIVWVNAAFTRLTGWRSTQAIGKRPGALLLGPRSDPATVERIRRRLDAGRGVSGIELLVYTRGGRPFWAAWSIHALADAKGQVTHFIAVQGEVSDRRRAEFDLRRSEERFRMMAELSVDWYWEQDASYRYTDISGGFERPTGLTREQVVGRTRWELFPQALTPSQWDAHRRMLEGRDEFRELELCLRGVADGDDGWISISGRPRYVDGEFAGYHGVASDITAARRSRRALRMANLQLERRVAERTGELRRANDELRRLTHRLALAKAAAESASVDKSQLLATMSHEIRTPMSGVLGSLDLLRCSPLDERQRTLVDVALGSGESLMALLNELLELSRIESGHLQLSQAAFSLRDVVEPVVGLFQANAKAKGLALSCRIDTDGVDTVLGDPLRLRQVLANLVGNAVKFTPSGRVDVCVDVARSASGLASARFEVRDTGVGIPEQALPSLFQPFSQVAGAHAQAEGEAGHGTGLGLSISQRIVQAMGGAIEVASRADAGSCFGFTLTVPVAQAPTLAEPDRAQRRSMQDPGSPGARMVVLVVEDSPVNRLVAVEMLASLGAEVHEARDGEQAIDQAVRGHFDLILMDCDLPVLDGYGATRRLRDREQRLGLSRTPIVALSANAYEEDVQRARASGMDDHLAKPCTREQLAGVLARWVARAEARS